MTARPSRRRAPEVDIPREPGEYTLDELAAKSGVPNRTIRFYQAKGVLPAPSKRGRIALYSEAHVERLQTVSKLQDKGLHLRAIREIVAREDLDSDQIQKWLGLGARLGSLSDDKPVLLNDEQLRQRMGEPEPGIISRLLREGFLKMEGDHYLVSSPAMLDIGRHLRDHGINADTALGFQAILRKRFTKAAREVVDFSLKRLGNGFGRSTRPEDIKEAVDALFRDEVGSQAISLIFNKEVENALREALQNDESLGQWLRGRG